jgi:membrane-associated protease RseP (regulator of RpoE activity)
VQIPKVPIVVPIHGWISFLIILLLHEGMHGILAREAKVRIKNAGLLLAGLLPIGAFVEPDEKKLRKAHPLAQVRTYSAGPSINIFASMALPVLVTIFLLVVYLPFLGGWMKEERLGSVAGVFVTSVDQNIDLCGQVYENPAYGKLLPGMRLLKINDRNIVTEDDAALALYLNKKPFTVQLMDANGTIVAYTIVPNELGLATFGIEEAKKPGYTPSDRFEIVSTIGSVLTDFIFWLMLLNFLIAVVNFLPTEPFDGGKIAKIILLPYFGWLKMNKKETEKFIGRLFTWIMAGLILANALPFFF